MSTFPPTPASHLAHLPQPAILDARQMELAKIIRGYLTRKSVGTMLKERILGYRSQTFELWRRLSTSLYYRSKFWTTYNKYCFLHLAHHEDELVGLWQALGLGLNDDSWMPVESMHFSVRSIGESRYEKMIRPTSQAIYHRFLQAKQALEGASYDIKIPVFPIENEANSKDQRVEARASLSLSKKVASLEKNRKNLLKEQKQLEALLKRKVLADPESTCKDLYSSLGIPASASRKPEKACETLWQRLGFVQVSCEVCIMAEDHLQKIRTSPIWAEEHESLLGQLSEGEVHEEEDLKELEQDVFTLMFLSSWNSPTHTFAVFIFFIQLAVLILCAVNLLNDAPEYNPFNVPINNSADVIAAQAFALVILSILRWDCFVTLSEAATKYDEKAIYRDGYETTRTKWIAAHAFRFIEGLGSIFVSFVFIVQADDVLEIFKDFAAIQFISELDNLSFIMAGYGFLGREVQKDTKYVAETKLRVVNNRNLCTRLGFLVSFLVLVGLSLGWAIIVGRQETNIYLHRSSCKRVHVRFGGEVYDLTKNKTKATFEIDLKKTKREKILLIPDQPPPLHYAYFSNVYMRKEIEPGSGRWETENDRPVYYDRPGKDYEDTTGKFSYCDEEKVWVFTIPSLRLNGDGRVRGRCGSWLLRSATTNAFHLEEVPQSGWIAWTGVSQKTTLDITCLDCTREEGDSGCSFNGKCNIDSTCTCDEFDATKGQPWFGELCQAEPPCAPIDVFSHGETSSDYAQIGHYMPLLNAYNKSVLTYQRPVYWNKRNLSLDLQNCLLYTGNRWFANDWLLTDLCPTNGNCSEAEYARFFESDFHAFWFETLTKNTLLFSEITESFTPVGLKWYSIGTNRATGDFGPFFATFDEDISFHCFQADCSQGNVCGNSGKCIREKAGVNRTGLNRTRCACNDSSSGYFCQFDSNHHYVRDQLGSNTTVCNEYFCDYLADQEDGGTDCSDVCTDITMRKNCWVSEPECSGDPRDV